jgi:hypothetical protein
VPIGGVAFIRWPAVIADCAGIITAILFAEFLAVTAMAKALQATENEFLPIAPMGFSVIGGGGGNGQAAGKAAFA